MERLIKKGKICAKSSYEIKESRIGIGMEKPDRDSFEPEKAYDKVAALGVKRIRFQSGWLNYVKATAEHFRGRITYYEIWNEPEGDWTRRSEPNPEEYASCGLSAYTDVRRIYE